MISAHSSTVEGQRTGGTKPPETMPEASITSPCAFIVAEPVAGPRRCTRTRVSGVSIISAAPNPSAISRKPGAEVAVIALRPAAEPPIRYCSAVISSGAAIPTPPLIIAEKIPDAGVIG